MANNTISRRSFLGTGAVLTGGIAFSGPLGINFDSKSNDILRIGIIGTGDRGSGLAALIKDIPQLQVVAMCDMLPFRLQDGLKHGEKDTKSYHDYRSLLDDNNVDAVIVATPFNSHALIAIDALDAGKHVYCEKTLSYGFEDTKKLVRKARATNKIFQTGHQYHSSRLYHYIAGIIEEGHIGDIALIESKWNRNGNWRRKVPDKKWERIINWRMYREYSGGLTAELCSHQIDFANWITGMCPVKVAGFGGIDYWKDGRETYDNVHVITEYPNGMKATYTCLTTNSKDDYQIKVMGKKGTIVINQDNAWIYTEINKKEELGLVDGVSSATLKAWSEGEGIPIKLEHKNPSIQALLDFAESIQNKTQPLSNVETGAKVAAVVQMALNAMDNNRVEYWKEEYNF